MIKSIRHKGLKALYSKGDSSGVQANHVDRLRTQLSALDVAVTVKELDLPGWRLHALKGDQKGRWSLTVNGNWRLTFEFRDGDAYVLDYEDYH
ncbi:Killer protein [Permianibacter sp. IMCC34836]|uniref:type II toxin-antitoxin system RelE/ParE family toxin n=1 Tax=Permianibacter fluminis TaxID=2738515 RepID=UPI00155279D3|nr:type II toxin-antitoxin system RelE/ParE family toxin [Permianibacter fluminis]NQD35981.1 Killer protein [Permianibacter fluminis]